MHIINIENIFYHITVDDKIYLKLFQYIIPIIFWTWLYIWSKSKKIPFAIFITFIIYLIYIYSYFVYNLFNNNVFSITIFWWIISTILLVNGINKDLIKFRTIGLYLLIFTVWKIVFYDIWYNIDTAFIRVLALMIVWILMIFISTLYSKKYNWNLKWELDFENLK